MQLGHFEKHHLVVFYWHFSGLFPPLTVARVGFYSPDKKWHLRNATSDLFQWSLTGVAQMLLFNRAAIYLFYSLNLGGGVGVGGRIWLWPPIHFQGLPGCLIGLLYPFPYLRCCSA